MIIANRSAAVVLEKVRKQYGAVAAVEEVSITIEAGTLVTLLGPSGCGKTTTLRMVAGLDIADRRAILIGGRDVTLLPPNERDVSMVFNPTLCSAHDGAENVSYGLADAASARRSGYRRRTRAHCGVWKATSACHRSCRAASSNASRAPAPWCWAAGAVRRAAVQPRCQAALPHARGIRACSGCT
jgi:ABC-type Fe3+/spermidine/putrescine transport system ATPase subunit